MEFRTSAVVVSKVKGHAKALDVKAGTVTQEDKDGNDAADWLATRGADQHELDSDALFRSQRLAVLACSVQSMMVEIVCARNNERNFPAD
eukprot:10222990-Karenia_brevis.AAC.1